MEKPREKRVIYVGGLDEEATEEIVCAAFIPFGDIVEVNIPKDFKESKGCDAPKCMPSPRLQATSRLGGSWIAVTETHGGGSVWAQIRTAGSRLCSSRTRRTLLRL